jgi:hypothetical protein
MEGAADDPGRRARAEQRLCPRQHLPRCPPRKGQQEDALGTHALVDEPGDPSGKRVGLAGAGARNDQQRPVSRCRRSRFLTIVQLRERRRSYEHTFDPTGNRWRPQSIRNPEW